MVIHFGISDKLVNIKAAFLYGGLDNDIYMECLQGMKDIGKDNCNVLDKFLCGLVKAR